MERLQSHVGYNKKLIVERREAYDAIEHLALALPQPQP